MWLQAVWDRLLQLQILDNFIDMPLIPIVTREAWPKPSAIKLCKLSDLLLLKTHKDLTLSDNFCQSLQVLPVTVVLHLPQYLPNSVIKEYIHLSDHACIMKLLLGKLRKSENLPESHSCFNQNSSNSIKNALLEYIANSTNISPEAQEFLKMLRK